MNSNKQRHQVKALRLQIMRHQAPQSSRIATQQMIGLKARQGAGSPQPKGSTNGAQLRLSNQRQRVQGRRPSRKGPPTQQDLRALLSNNKGRSLPLLMVRLHLHLRNRARGSSKHLPGAAALNPQHLGSSNNRSRSKGLLLEEVAQKGHHLTPNSSRSSSPLPEEAVQKGHYLTPNSSSSNSSPRPGEAVQKEHHLLLNSSSSSSSSPHPEEAVLIQAQQPNCSIGP